MAVIEGRDLVRPGDFSAVDVLGAFLPLLRERGGVGGNTGAKRVAIQHLGRGPSCGSRGVAQFKEGPVEILSVGIAGGRSLQDEVLHLFDCRLSMAIRLGVVGR